MRKRDYADQEFVGDRLASTANQRLTKHLRQEMFCMLLILRSPKSISDKLSGCPPPGPFHTVKMGVRDGPQGQVNSHRLAVLGITLAPKSSAVALIMVGITRISPGKIEIMTSALY